MIEGQFIGELREASEMTDNNSLHQTGIGSQGNFFTGAYNFSITNSTFNNINNITNPLVNNPKEITADDLLLQTPQAPPVFTGRSHLVEEAVKLLCEANQAHIAILGTGGIGKTSVALHIMENPRIKEKFTGRCYFIPCEILPDATNLVQGLVQAIGLQMTQGKGPLGILLDYLEGCPDVLLILDNFETSWNSKEQMDIKNLIEKICSFKAVSVIITMRGSDGPGQIKWHKLGGQSGLPPLELGPAKEAFCSLSSDGNYAIKEDDPILEKLLTQMDGMPLAIVLIVQHSRELPLKDLMEIWNDQKTAVLKRFGLGEQENRLTSIEVSIELTLNIIRKKLSKTGLDLLRLVAFLPSGIPDWLENLPKMLPNATMQVIVLKKACLIHEAGNKTLKMLTPIGEYIMKICGITEQFESQIWRFYESFINNLPQNSIAGDIQLGLHIANIFKILNIQIEKSFEKSHRNVLNQLYNHSQYLPGLVPLFEKYLRWDSQMNLGYQTELMFVVEEMFWFMGEYEKGIEIINDVEKLLKHQINQESCNLEVITSSSSISVNYGLEQTQAECYERWGRVSYYRSDYKESQCKIQQAMNLYQYIGNIKGAAQCLQRLGNISRMLCKYEEAKVMLEQAKEQFEGLGDRLGAAWCLRSMGNISRMLGKYKEAKVMLEQAKEQFEELGDRLGAARCLRSLGTISRMLGQYQEAKVMLEQAKEQFEEIGYRLGAIHCLQHLGDISRMLGQYEHAKIMLQQAKEQFEGLGERLGAAQCLRILGNISQMLGQYEEAKVMLEQAKQQFEGLGNRLGATQCLQSLGYISHLLGQLKEAKVLMEQAKEQFEGLGYRVGATQCLQCLGYISYMMDQYEEAKVMLEQAKTQFEEIGSRLEVAQCIQSLRDISKITSHTFHTLLPPQTFH
ncbi:hypothetical protein D9758_008926 [Tetrapyrgos nigripes]|uniref:TPR-like protein n=1 Tax=Tetrapyrgos nigripes TaxID=182062 RepID=A0A8H5LR88_9AGAR|nr:hypothetical protein D9758_008926 [Tetrapyrgos nigripes]